MASRPKSLAVTKISKISESPDIWGITILREPQRRIKFSTNFVVGIARIRVHTQWALTIVCGRREKVSAFSLFVCALSEVVKIIEFLCTRIPSTLSLCHYGIGCLQRGFMMNCLMMIQTIGRAMILVTMIRHTTTMIMRRILMFRLYILADTTHCIEIIC